MWKTAKLGDVCKINNGGTPKYVSKINTVAENDYDGIEFDKAPSEDNQAASAG